jgi:tripartite-type tricarboxylate transporter receptor subunit TctC
MRTTKRHLLGLLAIGALGLSTACGAQQAWPAQPVKVVVGFPAGSSTDVAIRVLAERLSQALGQQFVVDNRPGASSNIAARLVAGAPADGYTFFVGTIANTINATFQPATSVDISREFMPVAMVGSVSNLLVAHPSVGVSSMAELIAKAKANPGKISYASSGNGTSPHLSGELFGTMAGVQMLHVPYKGSSPAVVDLLAGQVGTMFAPASTILPHIRSGKVKALAATGLQRTDSAPDLPTVDELGLKGFETSVWFGLNAPKGTPASVIEKLRSAVLAAQGHPDLKRQFEAQGIDVVRAGPQDYARMIRSETDKWARVIKAANIQAD